MFKKINDDAKLPTRATKFSAGVDVYANEDCVIGAGETVVVGLGIRLKNVWKFLLKTNPISFRGANKDYFLKSHYIKLALRSSLGAKGLILPNGIGIIDLDYKDEIKMIIYYPLHVFIQDEIRDGEFSYTLGGEYTIKKGDRIGQLLLMEHQSHLFGIESEEERTGGVGSTGKN